MSVTIDEILVAEGICSIGRHPHDYRMNLSIRGAIDGVYAELTEYECPECGDVQRWVN